MREVVEQHLPQWLKRQVSSGTATLTLKDRSPWGRVHIGHCDLRAAKKALSACPSSKAAPLLAIAWEVCLQRHYLTAIEEALKRRTTQRFEGAESPQPALAL